MTTRISPRAAAMALATTALVRVDADETPILRDDVVGAAVGDATDHEVLAVLDYARRIKTAAAAACAALEAELAGRLGDRDWRVGDRLIRYASAPTMRVEDPKGLADWLGDRYQAVVPLTASTQIRKGALTAVATERGVDPQTILDTFTSTSFGPPKLSEVPVSRGPKFAAAMGDGEYRSRFHPVKETDDE